MSEAWGFLLDHGFDLFSVGGIILSLHFTAESLRSDVRSRRVENLMNLTQQHRDIWGEFYSRPQLSRVTDSGADLSRNPVTPEEMQFVVLVILHVYCWYRTMQEGEVRPLEGFARDIESFFNLPVPRATWRQKREFHDADFADFIDSLISEGRCGNMRVQCSYERSARHNSMRR